MTRKRILAHLISSLEFEIKKFVLAVVLDSSPVIVNMIATRGLHGH